MEHINFLVHHGVKGQKWGVRRYQNPDGTLTSEGKARLSKWKAKELDDVNRYYDKKTSKLDKKIAINKNRRGTGEKIDRLRNKREALLGRKKIETDFLKNASFDDMRAERRAIASAVILSTLVTLSPTPLVMITDVRKSKYARRENKNAEGN